MLRGRPPLHGRQALPPGGDHPGGRGARAGGRRMRASGWALVAPPPGSARSGDAEGCHAAVPVELPRSSSIQKGCCDGVPPSLPGWPQEGDLGSPLGPPGLPESSPAPCRARRRARPCFAFDHPEPVLGWATSQRSQRKTTMSVHRPSEQDEGKNVGRCVGNPSVQASKECGSCGTVLDGGAQGRGAGGAVSAPCRTSGCPCPAAHRR